jgi:hypothetical protein
MRNLFPADIIITYSNIGIMDTDMLTLLCVSIAASAGVIAVYIHTSARVALEQARTERAMVYAGKARAQSEAELAALSFTGNQPGEADPMSQIMEFVMKNPQILQQLGGALGQNNQNQVIPHG